MHTDLPQARWVPVEDLTPAEWNPREITDDRFGNLVRSIQQDPSYLSLRPILATQNGSIFAGNMRFRACVHLKWERVPCIRVPISEELAKRRALQDNRNWGTWDEQALAELIYEMHIDENDTSTLGFSEKEIGQLLGSVSGEGEERPPATPPLHCKTCGQILPEERP